MDIQEAMMALQQARGNPAAGMNPLAQLNPYGALQPGMAQGMASGVAEPDYNAILQQKLVNAQAEQATQGRLGAGGLGGLGNAYGFAGGQGNDMRAAMAQMMAERLGARTGGAMQFDPSMGMQGMHQQFRDWRQAGNQPVRPFGGGGGMGAMQPPAMQPPTQPAGVATLPAGGVQSALGADQWKQRGRLGGGGGGNANQFDTNAY